MTVIDQKAYAWPLDLVLALTYFFIGSGASTFYVGELVLSSNVSVSKPVLAYISLQFIYQVKAKFKSDIDNVGVESLYIINDVTSNLGLAIFPNMYSQKQTIPEQIFSLQGVREYMLHLIYYL